MLTILCLALFLSYFVKIEAIPFVRLDDGELMELSATFAEQGYLGSQMANTGHKENLYYHVHPPLYYLANGLVFKVLGVGVWQSRIISLMAALLVIYLTFLLCGRSLDIPMSINSFLLLAALFLSTPLFFVLSRSNRPEMLTLALIMSALLAYTSYLKSRRMFFPALAGLISGLALITQAYAFFVIILLAIVHLSVRPGERKSCLIMLAFFSLPLAGYLLWVARDWTAFYYQTIIARDVANKIHLVSLANRYLSFFSSFEHVSTTIFFLVSILVIWFSHPKRTNISGKPYIFPLLAMIIFMGVFLLIPVLNKYYYLILLPFIYLFVLYFFYHGYRQQLGIVVAVYLIVNCLGLGIYWHKYWDYNYPAFAEKLVKQLPPSPNEGILASSSLYPALRYYRFYAFHNHSITNLNQTYQGFSQRLKELKITYIIFDEHNEKIFAKADYIRQYLENNCRLTAKIIDPYYGSEGVKRNNLILLYRVY